MHASIDFNLVVNVDPGATGTIALGNYHVAGDSYPSLVELRGRRGGQLLRRLDPALDPVVDQSIYWNVSGITWGAGTSAPATRIR